MLAIDGFAYPEIEHFGNSELEHDVLRFEIVVDYTGFLQGKVFNYF